MPSRSETRSFWADMPVSSPRRGQFWVPGERVTIAGKTYRRGLLTPPRCGCPRWLAFPSWWRF